MVLSDWSSVARIVFIGSAGYVALLFLLRISGKRTLSKMNSFDLVITIAIGSTFATLLLSRQTSLLEGMTALALLVLLQFVVSWLCVRSSRVAHFVKSEPTLLFWNGRFLEEKMLQERVTRSEILQAIRTQGVESLSQCGAVVLESDGSFSVIKEGGSSRSSLQNVQTAGLSFASWSHDYLT